MLMRLFVFELLSVVHATVHTVNFAPDTSMWTIGVQYADMTIQMGEALKFTSYSDHDVALMHTPATGTHWEQCSMQGFSAGAEHTTIWSTSDFALVPTDKLYMPPTCGDFYITCSVPPHCGIGQRLKVTVNNVDGSACSSPCQDAACVTEASKPSSASGVVHDVIPAVNSNYWGMTGVYNPLSVEIGDSVVFRTTAGFHDVATVPTLDAFSNCVMTDKTLHAEWIYGGNDISAVCSGDAMCCPASTCGQTTDGSMPTFTWEAATAGEVYFVCTLGSGHHCRTGQKIKVTVNAASTGNAASTASSDAASTSSTCSNQAHVQFVVAVLMLLRAMAIM